MNKALWEYLYPLLASLAGALAALSIQPDRNMTWRQTSLFLVSGTGFGFFVFPLIFQSVSNPQIAGGICFLMSATWYTLLPLLAKKVFAPLIGDSK